MKDSFLPRFCSCGFSAQANVPQELHNKVIVELLADFKDKFGDDFADTRFKGAEDDMVITIYTK